MFYLWWNFLLVIGSPSQRPGTGWGARRWEKDCPLPRLPGQAPHPGYERRRARPLRHQLCHPNCRSEPQEGPRSPLLSGVKTEQRVHSYTLFFFLLVQISSFTCDSWKAFLWYLELTDQTVSNFSYLLQRFWPILTVTKISPSSGYPNWFYVIRISENSLHFPEPNDTSEVDYPWSLNFALLRGRSGETRHRFSNGQWFISLNSIPVLVFQTLPVWWLNIYALPVICSHLYLMCESWFPWNIMNHFLTLQLWGQTKNN